MKWSEKVWNLRCKNKWDSRWVLHSCNILIHDFIYYALSQSCFTCLIPSCLSHPPISLYLPPLCSAHLSSPILPVLLVLFCLSYQSHLTHLTSPILPISPVPFGPSSQSHFTSPILPVPFHSSCLFHSELSHQSCSTCLTNLIQLILPVPFHSSCQSHSAHLTNPIPLFSLVLLYWSCLASPISPIEMFVTNQ